MRKKIIITDLTRMHEGQVCIAGYDENGTCIRPILPPPGIHEQTLYQQGRPLIFPFAVVEFDLLHPYPQPPHTEDTFYGANSVRLVGILDEKQRRELLEKTSRGNLADVFDAPICSSPGHYILKGQGTRSLGTIHPKQVTNTFYGQNQQEGEWKYRLCFMDESREYWLTVTDLTWRYYCNCQREKGCAEKDISSELTKQLRSRVVYLRVGLARPTWKKYPDKCFIQITGVYTFPDYLQGKTFADFVPQSSYRKMENSR